MRATIGVALILTAFAVRSNAPADPINPVLDAKRKAAAQLFHEGKASDALTLLAEITAIDDMLYSDHMLAAHAQEKLGEWSEATAEYRRVLELLPPNPSNADERQARLEADKKVRQADPMSAKIDGVVDDFFRRLDALDRESIAGRNMSALGRTFRLRGMTWRAEKIKDRAIVEVFAQREWQSAGLEVKENKIYHVRAAGTWRVKAGGTGLIECTANGPKSGRKSAYTADGAYGQLMGNVGGKLLMLGEDVVFTAPATGPLQLAEAENTYADHANNRGAIQVIIIAE